MLLPVNKSYHYYCLKDVFLLPLLFILLIFFTSCKNQAKVSGPLEKISIAYSTAANAILVYIAFAKSICQTI